MRERDFTGEVSGVSSRRPGLADALSRLRDGDQLAVWKLERLGRSVRNLVELTCELDERGDFRSITDGLDTSTSGGRLFFHIMASIAQLERDLIRERTTASLEAARRKERVGGSPRRRTTATVESARRLLAGGKGRWEVAESLDVSPQILYRWIPASAFE